MEKILLDTDIGSDIDDALALAYLLANPNCELLGITTVSSESVKRAQLASVMCRAAGADIPIFPGVEDPFLVPQEQRRAQQAAALNKWPRQTDFESGQAISFMRDTIRRHPGEVTLLAIGPLTNVALLFTLDPEVPHLLKRLVMMCGLFTKRLGRLVPLEWNAKLDPHATAIVYHHDVAQHNSIGADVTNQVRMEAGEFKNRLKHDLLQPLRDMAGIWFQYSKVVVFHDPLAACTIFNENICDMLKGTVQVELKSEFLPGYTYWEPDPFGGKHAIATAVDQNAFFEEFWGVFS